MKLPLKILFPAVLTVVLCLVGSSFAANNFINTKLDGVMEDPCNWNDGVLPTTPGGNVGVNLSYQTDANFNNATLLSANLLCQQFRVGFDTSNTKFYIKGGSLTTGVGKERWFYIADNDATDTGHVIMSGGVLNLTSAGMMVGHEGHGTMHLSGGTINDVCDVTGIRNVWGIGYDSTANGDMNMVGGLISECSDFIVGHNGDGYFDMDGGTVYAENLIIANNVGSVGEMHLDGGLFSATLGSGLEFGDGTGTLDITCGELVLDGNAVDLLAYYVMYDKLSGYGRNNLAYLVINVVNEGSELNPDWYTHVTAQIPEPAMVGLLSMGGLVLFRRKRR